MNTPHDLLYSKTHEWVRETGEGEAYIGITDYAQHELGDLVFVNLPEPGEEATAGERIADVESVKAVSDVICPLSGTVKEANSSAADSPENINSDPYGTWLVLLERITGREELLSAGDYAIFCEKEG
ncbi:MAG: glycine cleavage system protein GcvH [Synergistaceae bacterium]|nr:glycine cleavage system protein GcvH [Synergistaceae bacterium]